MLELSTEQIGGWVGTFMLPLFRIGAMLMVMPVIGTQMVSSRIRLYLSLAITLVVVPNLPPMPAFDALSLRALLLVAEQVLIGALLGFALQLFFQVFTLVGQIIAAQMGLGFASMVDPSNGVSVAVIGQFLSMLTTLLFLAMNGHLVAIEVITESFTTLPVGSGLLLDHYWELANRLSWVMAAAILLSLPVITALLVINLAFGVMTRAAPQLNIFSIGFPMTLVLGMVVFWIGMADIMAHYQELAREALIWLRELARA